MLNTIQKTVCVKPHPAGRIFIYLGFIVAIGLLLISRPFGLIALLFPLFCLYFFRDPNRVTPEKDSLVIAPADGLVSAITHGVTLPSELEGGEARYTRVSIFLSVLDVHVNRWPVSGRVVKKVYVPGKFLNADLDKASEDNERCAMLLETHDDRRVGVVQIAGLIARRIVNEVIEGDVAVAGARFGIIRFGSRTDVYLPDGVTPLVCVGQRAVGGETVIADLTGHEQARTGRTS